jgi:hypothetical protein
MRISKYQYIGILPIGLNIWQRIFLPTQQRGKKLFSLNIFTSFLMILAIGQIAKCLDNFFFLPSQNVENMTIWHTIIRGHSQESVFSLII